MDPRDERRSSMESAKLFLGGAGVSPVGRLGRLRRGCGGCPCCSASIRALTADAVPCTHGVGGMLQTTRVLHARKGLSLALISYYNCYCPGAAKDVTSQQWILLSIDIRGPYDGDCA